MQNLVTYKFQYICENSLFDVLNQYNSVLRFTYNRLKENPHLKTSEVTAKQKWLNNCDLICAHLKNSAIYDAKSLIKESNNSIIFGGRKLFVDRCNHKISQDCFRLKRLRPLYCVGEACKGGNRLFKLIDTGTILLKLNKNNHFKLNLLKMCKKREKQIKQLILLQNNCQIPITYKLDQMNLFITSKRH